MLTNSMAHKYQRTNKCKKNHCYNQSCGWFRYFLELCQWRAECNTIQLISLLKLSSDSVTKGTLMQKKKKISMLGLVHGWIDSLYYPIPLQWVYLHWPLKTLGFPKETSVANCSQVLYTCVTFWPWRMCDVLTNEHMAWYNDRKREIFAMQNQHRYCV